MSRESTYCPAARDREAGAYAGGDYSSEESAFLRVFDRWQRRTGRRFPSPVEVYRLAKAFLAGEPVVDHEISVTRG
jgi:hypothetical protein